MQSESDQTILAEEPVQEQVAVLEESLQKQKKPRTEAQVAATAKMLATKKAKRAAEAEAISAAQSEILKPVVEEEEEPLIESALVKPKKTRAPRQPKEPKAPKEPKYPPALVQFNEPGQFKVVGSVKRKKVAVMV